MLYLPTTSAPNTPKFDAGFPKDLEDSVTSTGISSPPNERKESLHAWASHPQNPFNWPERRKWRTALISAAAVLLIGLNCTAIAPPGPVIAARFGISVKDFPNDVWPITAWNTGAAFGPMIGMPLLETFGLRKGYITLYIVFTLFVIPQAVAMNWATMIASRVIAGMCAGILMNVMAAIVADVWLTDEERNTPLTFFVWTYLGGVTLGPAFGAIFERLYWRWIFYIQLMIYGALFPFIYFGIEETRGPVILTKLSRRNAKFGAAAEAETPPPLTELLYDSIIRPAYMLCTEPVILFITLWSAFCFGVVYMCIQSIPQIYTTYYGFNDGQSGIVQLAILIGMIFGFFACIPQNSYYQRSARRNKINPGVPIPEARLLLSIPTSIIFLAGGLFWYGWTSNPKIHWIVPEIGLGFVGFAVMIIVTTCATYTTDAYQKYAGSAVSCLAFGESMTAAWLPLATKTMYNNLGFHWASSLLGCLALLLTIAPVVLWFKGVTIRRKSAFMKRASYHEAVTGSGPIDVMGHLQSNADALAQLRTIDTPGDNHIREDTPDEERPRTTDTEGDNYVREDTPERRKVSF